MAVKLFGAGGGGQLGGRGLCVFVCVWGGEGYCQLRPSLCSHLLAFCSPFHHHAHLLPFYVLPSTLSGPPCFRGFSGGYAAGILSSGTVPTFTVEVGETNTFLGPSQPLQECNGGGRAAIIVKSPLDEVG